MRSRGSEAARRGWREIASNEKMRSIAEDLPDAYALQALDSFRLDAALVWRKEKPKGILFICDDLRPNEATRKSGFTIKS